MVTLDTEKLYDLGNYVSEKIVKNGAYDATLVINVDKESLKKIDEDLFYKLNDEDEKREYVPTKDEIILEFHKVNVLIKARD